MPKSDPPWPSVSRRNLLQTASLGTAMTLSTVAGSALAQSPPPAGNAPVFRFRIGAFSAIALGDGQATWPAHPTYAPNAEEASLRRSLAANFMDPVDYTLNFNALFVDTGRNRVLIDTGAGRELGPELGRLAANLSGAGVSPESVDSIVLTHAHPDHIGGIVAADGALVFPKAQVFAAEREWAHWTAESIDFGGMTIPPAFKAVFERACRTHLGAVAERVTLFTPGAEVVPGISTIAASGHTAGHCAIRIASGASLLIHVGDAFHNQAFDLDNPRWATAFDLDPAAAFETRVKLLDQAAADRSLLMAYHMPFPGLGRIKKVGERYVWFPAPWLFGPDADPTLTG